MQETTPLSIYVHVPWCLKKCPYCDFNSHEITKEGFPEREYVEALLIDFERSFRHVNGRKISSIFFGGGTPSVFTPMSFERIITAIEKKTSFDGNIEITMEVNPEALTVDKFRAFKKAGINRLSMGVQSFVDRHLKSLGRVHNAKSAIMAIDESKSVFENINVDIMYGLPQQTLEDAETDILILLERNVTHISAYQLTIEPNTLFSSRRPCLPNETIMDSIEFLVKRLLREEGFSQYEVSAYCRSGFESKHNINYWTFGDYIGIGAGAHSKITSKNSIDRWQKKKNPSSYIRSLESNFGVSARRRVEEVELPGEFMMNALRLTKGFKKRLWMDRTGLEIGSIARQVETAEKAGLIYQNEEKIMPTEKGQMFLNNLIQYFL